MLNALGLCDFYVVCVRRAIAATARCVDIFHEMPILLHCKATVLHIFGRRRQADYAQKGDPMAYADTGSAEKVLSASDGPRNGTTGAQSPAEPKAVETMPRQQVGDLSILEAWDAAHQSAEDRQEDVSEVGRELARVLGARLAAQMLNETDMSLRDIEAKFGFTAASLSKMANGKTETGPTLWKLFALAVALGFTLDLRAHKKA